MQLRFSPTSPFVRKVRITAIEAGLQDQIEHITTDPGLPKQTFGNPTP